MPVRSGSNLEDEASEVKDVIVVGKFYYKNTKVTMIKLIYYINYQGMARQLSH